MCLRRIRDVDHWSENVSIQSSLRQWQEGECLHTYLESRKMFMLMRFCYTLEAIGMRVETKGKVLAKARQLVMRWDVRPRSKSTALRLAWKDSLAWSQRVWLSLMLTQTDLRSGARLYCQPWGSLRKTPWSGAHVLGLPRYGFRRVSLPLWLA